MSLPRMVPIRQKFRPVLIDNLNHAVADEVNRMLDRVDVKPGSRVAVTAGSRGIADLSALLKVTLRILKQRDLDPFIVAAMGSHGGGSADGKRRILAAAGITEETMQVPVRATTRVTRIGEAEDGTPLLLDAEAAAADAILLLNRVHPHPIFDGPIQSGLMKMLCIGLGNATGAQVTHCAAIRDGMYPTLRRRGRLTLAAAPVIGGLGVIENEVGSTAAVAALPRDDLERGEEALLRRSRSMRPGIPFPHLHLLIVDRIGKDVSGTGMDPKVVGRVPAGDGAPARPRIDRIYARALTAATAGNAHGVGLADFVQRRLADAIDWPSTRANALAAGAPQRSRLPLVVESDREAIESAFLCCAPIGPEGPHLVRIRDTGRLQEMQVSEALARAAGPGAGWSVTGDPVAIEFNSEGNFK